MKRSVLLFALCLVSVHSGFAQTDTSVPVSRDASVKIPALRAIDVGSVKPSGQTFVVVLDERNIDRAYAEWARPLLGVRTVAVSKELFRSAVLDTISRKLAATFPNGAPSDAALRVRLNIDIKLGQAPGIGISIGC